MEETAIFVRIRRMSMFPPVNVVKKNGVRFILLGTSHCQKRSKELIVSHGELSQLAHTEDIHLLASGPDPRSCESLLIGEVSSEVLVYITRWYDIELYRSGGGLAGNFTLSPSTMVSRLVQILWVCIQSTHLRSSYAV
jgi:hypothetical protein